MNLDINTIIATITPLVLGVVGLIYTHKTKKISDDNIFIHLFQEFNKRYDVINNDLIKIVNKSSIDELTIEEKTVIIDYFNLCAEEFYWYYHKKRIDHIIWYAWAGGMKYYYHSKIIRDMWKKEISYYEDGLSYYLPKVINKKNIKFFHEIKIKNDSK